AARFSRAKRHAREFIKIPSAVCPEAPDPAQMLFRQQVQRKGVARFYKLPGEMLATDADKDPRHVGCDRRLVDESGDGPAETRAGRAGDQPEVTVDQVKNVAGFRRVHFLTFKQG